LKEQKICCSLNFAPHYREEIFLVMEKELCCDFYFGTDTFGEIKKADLSRFQHKIQELPFVHIFKNFYLLKGQLKLAFASYSHYIITGQPYNISAWLLLIFNKIQGKQTYIWNHGWYGSEGFLKKVLKKIQFKLSAGYLLYGTYAKELMIQEGFDAKKLHVIYNSLDYTRQLDIRNQLKKTHIYKEKFNNTYPNLLFIGRLTKVKKLDMLLKAMQKSHDKGLNFNFIFIGEGTEKDLLKNLVAKYDLEQRVWFYGASYDEKVIGELLYNADLCVAPGNIGLTAIHSLMFGTPAITHSNFVNQMPEFEAIQEGKTGGFFKENDIDSLKERIEKWIEDHPKKSVNVIENCHGIIDTYYNPAYQLKVIKEVLA